MNHLNYIFCDFLKSILSDTGSISLMFYLIFILAAIGFTIYLIIKILKLTTDDSDKVTKIWEIGKYTLATLGISTVTLLVADLFKEREMDKSEMTTYNAYIQYVIDTGKIETKINLARFFSIVSPEGSHRDAWEKWLNHLESGKTEIININASITSLSGQKMSIDDELIKNQELTELRQKTIKDLNLTDDFKYGVIISADNNLDEALFELNKAKKINMNTRIYKKGTWFCTLVPNILEYKEAIKIRDEFKIRPESKKDEYVVSLNNWCNSPITSDDGKFMICN